ncbi:vancomycin high temperature exclusion protein [Bacteroides sp. 224]|uniref:SanA/YdcF family protein n=1 Tax=Bacteroides sp. 224 TaxID=2302936 RepID=UPI0013D0D77A|nr:ElyC/SanA/YdcF family protein [Bacteroides sp. 224]NDV64803.1 vancomycin high temperature exclusion protein [Bacteroides sp. 224]
MKNKRKLFRKMIIIAVPCLLALIVGCNLIIALSTSGKCYDNTSDIPFNNVGLLLGTSPVLSNGNTNLYFKYRIEAAAALYKAGKVKYFLVSGDNRKKDYNEPLEMKNALIERGVPEEVIYLDYAGFRTLDSMVRAKQVFGQTKFTIISQRFHNERAIYIAGRHDIETIGFDAKDVRVKTGIKTRIREWFARVKVFVDLVINKKPRFLGEEVHIPS